MHRNRNFNSLKAWLSAGLLLLAVLHASAQSSGGSAPCESTLTGMLDIVPVTSNIFSNTRNLRVWLPPGYRDPANTGRSYPVLYLLDGEMLFDRCTAPGQSAEWRVDETLTTLIASHSVEPLIIVGIDSTGRSRTHQFAPYRSPLPPYDPVAPDGEHFPEFIATEVVPLVNSRYRIAKDREHTGIGGSSLGAAAALYTVLHRADMFGLVLLESTSLQLGNGQLIRDTSPVVMGPIRASIGVGTEELRADVSKMLGVPDFNAGFVQLSKTLAANIRGALFNRPEVKLAIEPGAHHTPQYWGERFPAAVQFLYPPTSHQDGALRLIGSATLARKRSRAGVVCWLNMARQP